MHLARDWFPTTAGTNTPAQQQLKQREGIVGSIRQVGSTDREKKCSCLHSYLERALAVTSDLHRSLYSVSEHIFHYGITNRVQKLYANA